MARSLVAVLLLAAFLTGAQAQSSATVVLSGSTMPVAEAPATGLAKPHWAFVSRSTLTSAETGAPMMFEVALQMRNEAELQARVGGGERISAQEMAEKYEPLAADYQTVLDWLKGQGFTIVREDPQRHLAIFAQAKVGQIAQSLKVNFARVTFGGTEYTSAVTAPSVPSSLARILIGINGLQPHLHAHKHLMKPLAQSQNSTGRSDYYPSQIAQAYQATGLYSAGLTGAGQTIAIVIDTVPTASDLTTFWNVYGVSQSISNFTSIQVVQPGLGDSTAPSGEETLDTEWSSGIAPGAKIRLYAVAELENGNIHSAYLQILTDVTKHPEYGIHQVSLSFGEGESEAGKSELSTVDNYFLELANKGVTIFASSGDDGSTPAPGSGNTETENGPLQVESPADDPCVTGVGGTTLLTDANNNETSEVVWNSVTASGPGASGGGSSGYFSQYFPRPSWQEGTGVPTGAAYRLVPDISCAADPNDGAYIILNGQQQAYGGTSWASPTCAGFCALINQARANMGLPPLGQLNPLIYPLIGTSSFRDITSGNNATPNSSGNYSAGPGYDEATGIGVPLVQTLAQNIAGAQSVVTVNQGQTATMTVAATGSPVSYQWYRAPVGSNTKLSDASGVYSGTATNTLNIYNTTTAMSGEQFQCVVTYGTGPLQNNLTTLVVENPSVISTFAGVAGSSGLTNGGSPLTSTFNYPTGLVFDATGNLYIADHAKNVIRKISSTGVVTTAYGSSSGTAGATDSPALFSAPRDVAVDNSNNLYVTDEGNNLIRKIALSSGVVSTYSNSTLLNVPAGIAVDRTVGTGTSGTVYVTNSGANNILKIAADGTTSILAGSSTSTAGYQDGTGTGALFNQPLGLTVDSSGNIYVADYGNEVIRKITPGGVVTTVAGQAGLAGCADGTGTQTLFNQPRGIAVDSAGNLYVTDSAAPNVIQNGLSFTGNNLLREISPSGVVTTLAGQGGVAGTSSGTGSAAQFYSPCGVAIGANETLYIADAANNTIRLATPVGTPVLSVYATQPSAAVAGPTAGPMAGQFVVSRTANMSSSLTVNYALSGTGVSGVDYSTLFGTVTFPSGASTANVTVTPIPDPQATGTLTVQLTLTGSPSNVVINPSASSATVTISELSSSQLVNFSTWEQAHSIPLTTSAGATPANDGVANIFKYFYNINPSGAMTAADIAALPASGTATVGNIDYLTLTYRRYLHAAGISPEIQTSTDLQNWTTVDPPDFIQEIGTDPVTGDPILEVGVIVPANTTRQFIRLIVPNP